MWGDVIHAGEVKGASTEDILGQSTTVEEAGLGEELPGKDKDDPSKAGEKQKTAASSESSCASPTNAPSQQPQTYSGIGATDHRRLQSANHAIPE